MYENCAKCVDLGTKCDGPNFIAMSATDLATWCKSRKLELGLTNDKLAELSNMPKGTVSRIMAGDYPDFKYETIRPMLKVLIGESWGNRPCPAVVEKVLQESDSESGFRILNEHHDAHARKLEYLMDELVKLQKETRVYRIAMVTAVLIVLVLLILDLTMPGLGWIQMAF